METSSKGVLYWILLIYFIVSQIMTIKFWIEYAKETDSMLQIAIFGPIISEVKGIFWIFFI